MTIAVSAAEIKAAGGLGPWMDKRMKNLNPRKDAFCGVKKSGMNKDKAKGEKVQGKAAESVGRTSEHDEQVALFRMFKFNEEKYPELRTAFAIPNGGHRFIAVAAKLKAEGVKAGIPDIFVPAPRGNSHGLFIELKAQGGTVTDKQFAMMAALSSQGYACIVSYGWQNAWAEVEGYLESGTVELWPITGK
ncbi:MAG: VRR-NUC domain-containing protein [Deltaproteobacteria bacterium]|jgi:hypothetical protein|nr:VRR-NUC domain-containing protein [Deltaproteobacteria bacterium]